MLFCSQPRRVEVSIDSLLFPTVLLLTVLGVDQAECTSEVFLFHDLVRGIKSDTLSVGPSIVVGEK